ncbi:MAG: hypothetical protein AAGC81_06325 [Pseudomonadota bacterium]
MKRFLSSIAIVVGLLAQPAHSAPIGFEFNAGELIFVEEFLFDPEVEVILDFIVGEDILVGFTIDDATPDQDAAAGRGEFEDPNGTITLRGASSGTILSLINGVNIQLDDTNEFDLRNIAVGPSLFAFELFDDIDFETDTPIISDPDNLATSIQELSSFIVAGGFFQINNTALDSTARVGSEDSLGTFVALEFGPVASVPLPPAFLLLILGCAGVGVLGRRA